MRNLILLVLGFSSVVCFAQTPNSWLKKNDFAGFKREQALAITIQTKAYVGTGVDTSETVLNDWWEYEPGTDVWTQKANVPGVARRCAIGFGLNNKGYVGTGVDNSEAQVGNILSDFYEYDPSLNAWQAKANFPGNSNLGIYYATAFVVDNKGYVCGGKIGPSAYTAELWEYKPLIDTWAPRNPFPGGPRYNMSSVGIGNDAFIGLGTNFDTYMNDWWKYEVGSNSWEQKTDFPGGYRGGACAFSVVGKGFVSCGTNGGPKQDTYEYNPLTDVWSPRADYGGSERKQAICFVVGNRAFLGTGSGTGGKKNSMYEYISLYSASLEELEQEVAVYPTISNSKITIEMPEFFNYSSFELIDSKGNVVKMKKIESPSFDVYKDDLKNGTYSIRFISLDGMPTINKTLIFVN